MFSGRSFETVTKKKKKKRDLLLANDSKRVDLGQEA